MTVAIIVLVWVAVSTVASLAIGRAMRKADERDACQRRHPAGRDLPEDQWKGWRL